MHFVQLKDLQQSKQASSDTLRTSKEKIVTSLPTYFLHFPLQVNTNILSGVGVKVRELKHIFQTLALENAQMDQNSYFNM